MHNAPNTQAETRLEIRPLAPEDVPEADRIFRMAFGTHLGLPDPMAFAGDADFIGTRQRAAPAAALGAYRDGRLVGSNFAANWGSFGFFGPLSVHPDAWNQGIAQSLVAATMELFTQWGTRQVSLFTFPDSPRHVGLYRKFGFWPQHLTLVMGKKVSPRPSAEPLSVYSGLSPNAREASLAQCQSLADQIYPGLDLRAEILAVAAQGIGDTVLVQDEAGLVGFAVCHLGLRSEAGSGTAYVKFGAARPGARAAADFERLLSACEGLAAAHGLDQLLAGVNTSRHEACQRMLAYGFRSLIHGVAMQQGNGPGFNRPDCFVMDDWR